MTVHALEIYRRETRWELERVLGRKATNAEHDILIRRLHMQYRDWVKEQANKVAFEIGTKKAAEELAAKGAA